MKTLLRTEPRSGVVHISIDITIIVNNILNSYPGSWVQLPTEKDPQHEGSIRQQIVVVEYSQKNSILIIAEKGFVKEVTNVHNSCSLDSSQTFP